jgi:hypothetical protein
MQKKRDAVSDELIDQIGPELVRERLSVSSQRLHMWRVRGIPLEKRIAFHNLALECGIEPPPEFLAEALRSIGLAA